MRERQIFTRLNAGGKYEYGITGPIRHRVFGEAPTQREAYCASLAVLEGKLKISRLLANVSTMAGIGLLGHLLLRMKNDLATWGLQVGLATFLYLVYVLFDRIVRARALPQG